MSDSTLSIHEITAESTVDRIYDLLYLLDQKPVGADSSDLPVWLIDRDSWRIFLAYTPNEKIVGFTALYVNPKLLELPVDYNNVLMDVLYVVKSERGRGYGKVLLDNVKAEYGRGGFCLRTDDADAQRFYRREKFMVVQKESHALEHGKIAIKMAWVPGKRKAR